MLEAKPVEYNLDNLRYVSERIADLPHFIFYGTLLGFVRENSIIVGDDDIDILVHGDRKADLVKTFKGTELRMRRRHQRFKTPYFAQGVRTISETRTFVDFYLYEDNKSNDYIIDHWNFRGRWKQPETALHIPKSLVFPVQPATMQGIAINVPAKPEACCEFLYGTNWRTPLAKKSEYTTVIENHRPKIVLL